MEVATKADMLYEVVRVHSRPSHVLEKRVTVFRAICFEMKTTNLQKALTAKDTSSHGKIIERTSSDSRKSQSEPNVAAKSSSSGCENISDKNTSHSSLVRKSSIITSADGDGAPDGACDDPDSDCDDPDSDCDDPDSAAYYPEVEADVMWSTSKAEAIPMEPRLECLETQHFMELLSLITASDSEAVPEQVHGIGLYVVMHRVYVTGLFVGAREDHGLGRNVGLIHKSRTIGSGTLEGSGLEYRMVCSKYFSMFKPEHFKALMDLVRYLIFHQHKEKNIF